MSLPADHRARSVLLFCLFAATAVVLQLALHFIDRSTTMAGQPGHALAELKAVLFCIATGMLLAVNLAAVRVALRRRPVPARVRR